MIRWSVAPSGRNSLSLAGRTAGEAGSTEQGEAEVEEWLVRDVDGVAGYQAGVFRERKLALLQRAVREAVAGSRVWAATFPVCARRSARGP